MKQSTESKRRLEQEDIHDQWLQDYLSEDLNRFYDEAFQNIVEQLGDTRDKHLLDLGCGYCFHTSRLAKSDLRITAVDFSTTALSEARRTITKAGLEGRVSLERGDATSLPFSNASFDHVLIWGVLMHVPDIEAALSEAARVLKPGGS
ncbi:class I SAM-dependent methyltransferase [Sphingomonas lutea]|uniref:Class I SAM-dependent methyltransferase n=1 Tax=Sphingomonas lutea TaxID=1045317 RepID=A0A7G9SH15_9SPHN|nr:class I SAM-dependent methyltransferase [Sphingomonas lutea]QNN67140.1 class I SAM-dependent methyltransferase [Sphingomonas lutea]